MLQNTSTGYALARIAEDDIQQICFNTAYCLTKKEHPFSDNQSLLHFQFKNGINEFKCYKNDCYSQFYSFCRCVIKNRLLKDLTNARKRLFMCC